MGQFTLPYWVRMVRSGSTFTGYYASDSGGVPGTWAVQNSTTISMGTDVYIGLCVTSHSTGVLCTAVFDNIGGSTQAANDLMDAMLGVNASLWVRAEFNLEAGQAETFDTFNLRMRYEDGFVAYLNKELVATDNNPTALTWNSTAPTDRPIEESETFTSTNLHLQSFDGRVDVSGGCAAARFFTEDIPRFNCCPQFHSDVLLSDVPDQRKTELKVRREPSAIKRKARFSVREAEVSRLPAP